MLLVYLDLILLGKKTKVFFFFFQLGFQFSFLIAVSIQIFKVLAKFIDIILLYFIKNGIFFSSYNNPFIIYSYFIVVERLNWTII